MAPIAPSLFATAVSWLLPRPGRKTGGVLGRSDGFLPPTRKPASAGGQRNPALFRVPTALRFCMPLLGLVAACSGGDSGSVVNPEDAQSNTDGLNTADAGQTDGQQPTNSGDAAAPVYEGCTDSDKAAGNPTGLPGTVTYINAQDDLVAIHDTCKTPGILAEAGCEHFTGATSVPTQLVKFVFCPCDNGICTDAAIKPCEDPQPDAAIPGAAIYQWNDTGLLVDACVDAQSVLHTTCDKDGIEKQDITACPPDKPCANGICGGVSCTDTDQQNDPHTRGKIYLKQAGTLVETIWDDCVSGKFKTHVGESSCLLTSDPTLLSNSTQYAQAVEEQTKSEDHQFDCTTLGEVCSSGLCEPATPPAVWSEPLCEPGSDTDPENDPLIQGKITLLSEPIFPSDGYDHCQSGFSTNVTTQTVTFDFGLTQVDCVDGKATSTFSESLSVCINGVFTDTLPTCHEPDGGNNPNSPEANFWDWPGTTMPHHINDTCNLDGTIREYLCIDNNHMQWINIPCPPFSACQVSSINNKSDQCVACVDKDPDNNPDIKGTVTIAGGTAQSDYCVGDKLRQVYCTSDGGFDASPPALCPSGVCDNGECK